MGITANRNELNKALAAVLLTLMDEPIAPESSLYLALGCTLEEWALVKKLLVGSSMVTDNGDYSLTIADFGRETVKKIRAAMA